jgi:hypothetical protein
MLDADEREAILGDLAESGETGSHALLNVLGLVVRRQAGFWNDWRPWLALVGLIGPVGILLSLGCSYYGSVESVGTMSKPRGSR